LAVGALLAGVIADRYSTTAAIWTVAALTAQRLGNAGVRAPRTVSRVIAWARDIGLIVVVEHAASAEFLGTHHGRTPTYALVTNTPLPQPPAADQAPVLAEPGQLTLPVEESGDLPASSVENKPLNGRRLKHTAPAAPSWPIYGIPQTAQERNAATLRFLERLGLDRGGVSAVPLWRARALLKLWWDAGASPAGLLWAIDNVTSLRQDVPAGDFLFKPATAVRERPAGFTGSIAHDDALAILLASSPSSTVV